MNTYKTGIFILENKLLYNSMITPWEYGNLQKVSLTLQTVRKVSQTLCTLHYHLIHNQYLPL